MTENTQGQEEEKINMEEEMERVMDLMDKKKTFLEEERKDYLPIICK